MKEIIIILNVYGEMHLIEDVQSELTMSYERFAYVYDELMKDAPYDKWLIH